MRTQEAYTFAIYDPDKAIRHVGLYTTEDECWQIYLGWPSEDEIKGQKDLGFKCVKVVVSPRP
jgi:hypothetical protein